MNSLNFYHEATETEMVALGETIQNGSSYVLQKIAGTETRIEPEGGEGRGVYGTFKDCVFHLN